jgi:hypothetical protein
MTGASAGAGAMVMLISYLTSPSFITLCYTVVPRTLLTLSCFTTRC